MANNNHIFFIYSSVNGHLGCVYIVAIVLNKYCWNEHRSALSFQISVFIFQINTQEWNSGLYGSSMSLFVCLSLYCKMVELIKNLNYNLIIFSPVPNFIQSKLLIQKWSWNNSM